MRWAGLTLVVALAAARPAAAQDARAEALNDAGKSLYNQQGDYEAAAARFREAIGISPDPRYFYNLCTALDKLKRYAEALAACAEVRRRNPRPELAEKTERRAAAIRESLRPLPEPQSQPLPEPQRQPDPPPEPQPRPRMEAQPEAPVAYRWALGADVGGLVNSSLGDGLFAKDGAGLKLHADFFVAPEQRIGVQTYVDLFFFGGRVDQNSLDRTLSIYDAGAAVYWHTRLGDDLWLTPLAGAHLGVMQPYGGRQNQSFITVGLRLEAGFQYVWGGGQHVLSLVPFSAYVYAPQAQISGNLGTPADFGFDQGGTVFALTIGYTLRFNGPVGSFILE